MNECILLLILRLLLFAIVKIVRSMIRLCDISTNTYERKYPTMHNIYCKYPNEFHHYANELSIVYLNAYKHLEFTVKAILKWFFGLGPLVYQRQDRSTAITEESI